MGMMPTFMLHLMVEMLESRVNLEVGLGRVPDDVVVIPPSTCQGRPGPARQRRHARRAELRKHAEEAKVKEEESSITYNDKTDVEEVTTEKVVGLLDSGELVEMKQVTEDNLSTEEVTEELMM